MSFETRFHELGLTLPPHPIQGGNYVSAKTVGNMVYLSGVISMENGVVMTGVLGTDRTVEDGYAAARACALTQLAVLHKHLGSLDAIAEIVSVNGYVHAADTFTEPPRVINGFSDLIVEVFGEAGRHVRAAIGVNCLPRNALVEVQMTVRIA